jgi:hypothetical protein
VISESPIAGTTVNSGSAVNLVVSTGPAQVAVPNVVGDTQAAATTAITGAGLVVGSVTPQSSPTVASGKVISESPIAGTSVNSGSAVNLVVSTGPAQVAVPNVVGDTQAAATTAITGAGLVVGSVTPQSSPTVASGKVISESPIAGTTVNSGSAVNLVVSTGSVPVTTSLSPSTAALGGPTFTLTVNGSNFVQGATVNWNGSPLTTTYVSATELQATVPSTDLAAAGSAQVTVTNPMPGGGTSTPALTFTIQLKPPALTSPAPGSTLGTLNVTFTWTPGNATNYQLWLGTGAPGSSNLYSSGSTTATSVTVASIPAKAATVYVRLNSVIGGVTQYIDYTYTEAGAPGTMISPAPNGILGSSNVTFTWTAGYGATQYNLWLGTSGPGSASLYASGWSASTSVTVPSLPAKAVKVYARLYSDVKGVTDFIDYTYTEAGAPSTMISPAQGNTLGTSNVKFTWTAGYGVTQNNLWLGLTGPGSASLYASGWSASASATVPSLPAKGATVYARLYSDVNGVIQYVDYTYTETPLGIAATMITPLQGSTLGTSNVMFTWTKGTGATQYNLWLGLSGPGSASLYNSGWSASMSATVPSLPAKGVTVYARLYSDVNGVTKYNDYTYTEQ